MFREIRTSFSNHTTFIFGEVEEIKGAITKAISPIIGLPPSLGPKRRKVRDVVRDTSHVIDPKLYSSIARPHDSLARRTLIRSVVRRITEIGEKAKRRGKHKEFKTTLKEVFEENNLPKELQAGLRAKGIPL